MRTGARRTAAVEQASALGAAQQREERAQAGSGLREAMLEIRLPTFEGPLDLLLTLIQRRELDITTVSLVAVADQYLAAVHGDDSLGPAALAEFVSIGARLLQLKSRALLPQPEEAEEEATEDAGEELVTLLIEYRRYREAAEALGERADGGMRTYPRGAPAPVGAMASAGGGLEGVTLEALYAVMLEVLERMPEEPAGEVERVNVSLAERIEALEGRLRGRGRAFSFRRVIAACTTRLEVVVTFIALLELLKRGTCEVEQAQAWGDIRVRARETSDQPAASTR